MSRLLFFILLIISQQVNAGAVTSRPTDTIPSVMTSADYRLKSNQQRNGAIVMLSVGGAGLFISAIGVLSVGADELANVFTTDANYKPKSTNGYEVAAVISGAMMLGSIPLFIASHRNKKLAKAMTMVSFKMESANKFQTGVLNKTYYPAMRLRFTF